jgi:hypothetical protein
LLWRLDEQMFSSFMAIRGTLAKVGQPEIWQLPHGHISALFVPGLAGRVLRCLEPRLNGDAVRTLNKMISFIVPVKLL